MISQAYQVSEFICQDISTVDTACDWLIMKEGTITTVIACVLSVFFAPMIESKILIVLNIKMKRRQVIKQITNNLVIWLSSHPNAERFNSFST